MRANSESGFSVVELAVAAVLTVGITGAVFGLLNRNQQVFVTESSVTDMNQNMRTAVDFLTRDIQSAGMGMSRPNSSFAGIFYNNAATGPDQILILNADPYAPSADLLPQSAGLATFFVIPPPGLTVTGSGSTTQITYFDQHANQTKNFYQAYSTSSRQYYVCYDDTKALVFALSANAQSATASSIQLNHDAGSVAVNRSGTYGTTIDQLFSTPVDAGEPDYNNAQISALGSMIGYRVNQNTGELERTEDLTNWYGIARGVTNLKIQYRTLSRNSGTVVENVTSTPTDRRSIRAVIVTISAETPDLPAGNKGYRQEVHTFEVAPRNLNLLNNNNLSSNTKSTWKF